MDLPYSEDEIVEAIKDTVRANGLDSCYIRPIAYLGYGEMGLNPLPCQVNVSIAVWPWGAYLGDEGVRQRRPHEDRARGPRMTPTSMPTAAKGTGMYINSSLAKVEALHGGYDEAILLNTRRADLRRHGRERLRRAETAPHHAAASRPGPSRASPRTR